MYYQRNRQQRREGFSWQFLLPFIVTLATLGLPFMVYLFFRFLPLLFIVFIVCLVLVFLGRARMRRGEKQEHPKDDYEWRADYPLQPDNRPYEQGYTAAQGDRAPWQEQPQASARHHYEDYEQPSSQYPEQMPPM